MTHGSLFSGIGGFDLAAEWMGWENKFHCEWDFFCQRVLKYYWPNAESYGDIDETDFTVWKGRIDVLSGGFPCQPYSSSGKRKGKEDDRHKWPQMLRAIREIQPGYIVGENVRGLTNWNRGMVFDEVQADLEAEGYEVLPFLLPATSCGGNHQRERIWFVAHAPRIGLEKQNISTLCQTKEKYSGVDNAPIQFSEECYTESPFYSRDYGLSQELDGIAFSKWENESIKAVGNAVVPQVVFEIFKAIELLNNSFTR